jgi:hypothetical protein
MDMTALLLALPRLSAGLGATNVQQLWISDSYGFMVAGLVITMGTLGDRNRHLGDLPVHRRRARTRNRRIPAPALLAEIGIPGRRAGDGVAAASSS